jgi:hypothetical protein
MSKIFGDGTDKKILILSFAAAIVTVITGILHLWMVPGSLSHNLGEGILFLVGGALQIFWAIPVMKRWGKIWQVIGIVGTTVFFILWFTDRLHVLPEGNVMQGGGPQGYPHSGNFSHGNMPEGGFPRGNAHGSMGIGLAILAQPIEICQIAFIGLYIVLSKMISGQKKADSTQPDEVPVK